jgi:hypothetical protein
MDNLAKGVLHASTDQIKDWTEQLRVANERGDKVTVRRIKKEIADYGKKKS